MWIFTKVWQKSRFWLVFYLVIKGIWQYKLSLSYLKGHLKLYINFLYNYSVSCLAFEINRLILTLKAACIPPSWICIRYAYVTSRVKAKFCLANLMSLSIWNSIFWSLFSTQLTRNILRNFSKKFSPTWRSFNKFTLLVTSSKTQLIRSIIIPRWQTVGNLKDVVSYDSSWM
jgi:hypothetical protein